MKFVKFEQGKNWWQGQLTLNYNLKWLLLPLLLLAFLLVYLWRGLVWVGEHIWKGIVRLATFLKQVAGRHKNCWWFALLLLFLFATFFVVKRCSSSEPIPASQPVYTSVAEAVDAAWDDVLIARIYLDYKGDTNAGGLKYVKGDEVKEVSIEQLADVIDYDWRQLVKENVTEVMNKQQMTVTTLLAMRMGENGFVKSKFLELINQGNFAEAGQYIVLVDARGNVRNHGTEAKQYLRILRLMWENKLTVSQLEKYPHHSYKAVPLSVSDDSCLMMLPKNTAGTEKVCDIVRKFN